MAVSTCGVVGDEAREHADQGGVVMIYECDEELLKYNGPASHWPPGSPCESNFYGELCVGALATFKGAGLGTCNSGPGRGPEPEGLRATEALRGQAPRHGPGPPGAFKCPQCFP